MNHKIFSSPEEVESITKNSNKVLLIYENDVFDVTNFLHDHPGNIFFIILFLNFIKRWVINNRRL